MKLTLMHMISDAGCKQIKEKLHIHVRVNKSFKTHSISVVAQNPALEGFAPSLNCFNNCTKFYFSRLGDLFLFSKFVLSC